MAIVRTLIGWPLAIVTAVSTAWSLNGLPGDASNTAAGGALGAADCPDRRQGRFMPRVLAAG